MSRLYPDCSRDTQEGQLECYPTDGYLWVDLNRLLLPTPVFSTP